MSKELSDLSKSCEHKHTKYQPTMEEFRCPRCKAKAGDFAIDEGPNMECELLHEEDVLVCFECQKQGRDADYLSGKRFAARIQEAKGLVPCPHCKGKGLVHGPAKKAKS